MKDFEFDENYDWLMGVDVLSDVLIIGNFNEWIEELITMGITHETIHVVLDKIENSNVSDMFDNIFGFADPSVLLCSDEKETFYSTQLYRLRKRFIRLF